MSERETHCVEIDQNPELWDKYISQRTIDRIEATKLSHNRYGSCNRCGSCCYWIKMVDGKKVLMPCKYLTYDDNKVRACSIWDTPELPNICKGFPVKRDLTNKHPDCGFYWVEKTE